MPMFSLNRIPIISSLLKKRRINRIKQSAIVGNGLRVNKNAIILLLDGSVREDILIGENVTLSGKILTQNHGKIVIGNNTELGYETALQCVDGITIGDYTCVARNTYICDNNNHPISPEFHRYAYQFRDDKDARLWRHSDHAPIVIGSNCWIGQYVRIQKGVTIGDNSIIAANSVVTKSVPANCIAAGNPAKVVKTNIDQIPAPSTCEGYNEWKKKQL